MTHAKHENLESTFSSLDSHEAGGETAKLGASIARRIGEAELHAGDREDLRRSGLTDETISSMGCYSVEADEIQRLTGVPQVLSSGYAIPYKGVEDQTGEPYKRFRLREPGKMRYLSGKGDDIQLYIPPSLKSLPTPDLLIVTEGEKKAARAVQDGIHCVALQGVHSWGDPDSRAQEKVNGEKTSEETLPLASLLSVAKRYKKVLILGDSDLVGNPQAASGLFGLERSMRALGVRAAVAYCPPSILGNVRNVQKQGLDDWLQADRNQVRISLEALFCAAEVFRDQVTDSFNAQQFSDQVKDSVAFSRGDWSYWDESAWIKDDCHNRRILVAGVADHYTSTAQKLRSLVSSVVPVYAMKDGLPADVEDWSKPIEFAIKALQGGAVKLRNLRGINAALALAESHLRVADDVWDRDPHLLGVQNGVVDLSTSELLLPLPHQYITRRAGTEFRPEATAVSFIAFLESVQPDPEVREFLQCLAGYCAIGRSSEQKLFSMIGSGANGKSTFMGVLMDTLGAYASKAVTGLLAEQSPDKPRNDMAALAGVRLVSISETPRNFNLDAATMKVMTGGDAVTARFLHHEFFTYRPAFTPILDTNHPLRPTDRGDAVWRRLVTVPWPIKIAERDRNMHLREELLKEMPGILAWVIEGARKYLATGMPACAEVDKATKALRASCDEVGDWIEQRVIVAPSLKCRSTELFKDFESWRSTQECHEPVSMKFFISRLADKGFRGIKSDGNMYRVGIALHDERVSSMERGSLLAKPTQRLMTSRTLPAPAAQHGAPLNPTPTALVLASGGCQI